MLAILRRLITNRPAPMVPRETEGRIVILPNAQRVTVIRTIDCIRQGCPRPQLLTIKAFESLEDGDVLELLSDNPSAVESMPELMLVLYSTHLATVREDGFWRVYVRKGIAPSNSNTSQVA